MTTFVLSMVNAKPVSSAGVPVVLGLAVASVASTSSWPACGSSARDTFATVAFSSHGAFWPYMFVASLQTTGAVALGFFQPSITFIVLGPATLAPTRTSSRGLDMWVS
jgi:succinate-acetate transporter protein